MARKIKTDFFDGDSFHECLSSSIQKFFGLKPDSDTIPEIDEILSPRYRHVVVVCFDGLESEFLEHDLTHKDFMRRHYLNNYPTVIDDGEKELNIKSYAEIISEINGCEKMKAFEILPENYKSISSWASAIRKTCKCVEKTFTYARWDQLADIVKVDHKNSNGVYKAMQELNAEMAFLCEDLEDTVFIITSNPDKVRQPEDGTERKIPILWYENKPKKSGLVIYYLLVLFLVIFLIRIMM